MFIGAAPKPLEVHASLSPISLDFHLDQDQGPEFVKIKTGECYFELKFAANYENSWPLK